MMTGATFCDAAFTYQSLVTFTENFFPDDTTHFSITYPIYPVILNCQGNLATYQRRWQLDLIDKDAQNGIASVALRLTELRRQAEQKYSGTSRNRFTGLSHCRGRGPMSTVSGGKAIT